MSSVLGEGTAIGTEDRVAVLLEIARLVVEMGEGTVQETEAAFFHGVSLGMRIGSEMTPPECLALERAAVLRRHHGSVSREEIVGLQRLCSEQSYNVVMGKS